MKVIVGLGNPGREYEDTRHNVGFMVVDEVARRHDLHWRNEGQVVFAKKFGSSEFLLAKPKTFMNLSGCAVAEFVNYRNIATDDLLVIVDDVDLPLGRVRARARGSGGTHNGLKSVVQQLGTTSLARLRIGVGRGDRRRDLADYVLATFEPAERAVLDEVITRAADAAEMFIVEGIEKVMNTYNPDATGPEATD
ncbi:MAG: aminoacyl-tRNA hydrolase [Acidobacteria bacterium]|nr:aminoacyl-tRNA hydrolase [Acidobacteriota bacterium]